MLFRKVEESETSEHIQKFVYIVAFFYKWSHGVNTET